MPLPAIFTSTTPNIGLPLLMPGQAQKEFFINQALGILDGMHAGVVDASIAVPPAAAPEGSSYRITAPAADAWFGCEDQIAIRIGEDWHFIAPRDGMRLVDRQARETLFYDQDWRTAAAPEVPAGGAVIDIEARTALAQLIDSLRELAILGPQVD